MSHTIWRQNIQTAKSSFYRRHSPASALESQLLYLILVLPCVSGFGNIFLVSFHLSTLWISPVLSVSPNMSQNYLVQPFAVAATTQVKLYPYDEEEPHIWFRLIEAQFAGRVSDLKNSDTLIISPACQSKSFGTFSTW